MSFIGTQELIIILMVALLVVGPKRLPDLAKNLGKGIRNFKNAAAKMRSELDESGALEEINQLKASVQGIHEEIRQPFQADAVAGPKPEVIETAPAIAETEAREAAGYGDGPSVPESK